MTDEKSLQNSDDRNKRPSALVVLPVYNEENALRNGVETLTAFLKDHDNYEWKIVISDNNSNDNTGNIGRELESENPLVSYLYIPRKGR
ncbi:MAG: glycosyltransferase, partial [Promethearchaeota archaeon]